MKVKFYFINLIVVFGIFLVSCNTISFYQAAKEPVKISHKIADKGCLTSSQLVQYFISVNPQIESKRINELAKFYIKEAEVEGINSDVAFAQMCLETGYLQYGNLVQPEWNNFCGLGAIDKEHPGEKFETVQMGVRAHIQHLHAYGTTEDVKLVNELVDKRYKWVRPRGKAPQVEQLSGTWAADTKYAAKIVVILEKMQDMVNQQ